MFTNGVFDRLLDFVKSDDQILDFKEVCSLSLLGKILNDSYFLTCNATLNIIWGMQFCLLMQNYVIYIILYLHYKYVSVLKEACVLAKILSDYINVGVDYLYCIICIQLNSK